MSKKSALENEINWLKTIIAILSVAFFGLFAWMAHHYETAKQVELVFAVLLLFVMLIFAIVINQKVYRNLAELEELEE